jgi:oligopeptide/dipeptide ABC transporter ATP-binding protein
MTAIAAPSEPVVALRDVSVALRQGGREMVSGVSLSVGRNEIFGIVGESGSGKTLLTRTVFGLHDDAYVSGGEIDFDGEAVSSEGHFRAMKRKLGRRVGFIPQDPYGSLNPSMRIGRQITEALYLAHGLSPRAPQTRARAAALLDEVGIPEPEIALDQYPDQFSGGMRQRIVIAIALAQEPTLLIADEPTTALDATTQRRVIDLIVERSRTRGLSVILISHNLELLRQNADRIAVLYGGQLLAVVAAGDLGARDTHPYAEALYRCLPSAARSLAELRSIPGEPAGAGFGRTGCAFGARCPWAEARCRTERLPQGQQGDGAFSACILGRGA